jgi:hypothetical protein
MINSDDAVVTRIKFAQTTSVSQIVFSGRRITCPLQLCRILTTAEFSEENPAVLFC